ncbi:MAG: Replication-associated recombination protein RarA, partial [uncultured Blastococcus sp.]
DFAVRGPRGDGGRRGRRCGRAAGGPDASPRPGRGGGAAAPARRARPAAAAGRVRRADVAGPVRPPGHRQDDARARHLAGDQAPVRAAVGPGLRGEGGPRSHHRREAGAHLRRPPDGPVHRRGAPLLQDPAGLAARRGRGPDRQPDRRHHGEPVLLRGQPLAEPLAGPRPAAAQRRGHPRRPAPGAHRRTRPRRGGHAHRGGADAPGAGRRRRRAQGADRPGVRRRRRPGGGRRRAGPRHAGDRGRPGRGALRPPGRPALRRRQRADQDHPRQRCRRRDALPGPHGGGRRGPALHRPPAGDQCQRGHRDGRPHRPAHRRRRGRRRRLRRDAGGPFRPGAGRRPPGHRAEVQCRHGGHGRVGGRRAGRAGRPGAPRAARRPLRRSEEAGPRADLRLPARPPRRRRPAAVPARRPGREGLLPPDRPRSRGAAGRAAGKTAGHRAAHPL